ncbi:unnamed protein product [Echinostoma caproni]|uniref:TBC domain-containing protein kinase-like protein n=1 Tax=Echinostoma caproni TaxID=27848 RepID=A0A183ATH7_9TREM|nr:unnamed protein product [Echinostoma caproni]
MSFELPLGLSSFRVSASLITDVEVNGLPRLPSSVACYARLRSLRALCHPNLCRYLDATRRKPERLFVITEAYSRNVADINGPVSDSLWLSLRLSECFSALHYLGQHGLVHSCLNPSYIMLDQNGCCKLSSYGLYYITGWGREVDFPVADPIYSAPEVFCFSPILQKAESGGLSSNSESVSMEAFSHCPLNTSSDVWSLGLIFLELIHGRQITTSLRRPSKCGSLTSKPFTTIRVLIEGLRFCNEKNSRLSDFLHFLSLDSSAEERLRSLELLCQDCLHFDARLRPKPDKVIEQLDLIVSQHRNATYPEHVPDIASVELSMSVDDQRRSEPSNTLVPETVPNVSTFSKAINFLTNRCDMAEIYHYWCLAGGNLDVVWKEAELCSKQRLVQLSTPTMRSIDSYPSKSKPWNRPPVLRIPHYLALMRNELSSVFYLTENWPSSFDDERISFDPRIVLLPYQRLLERIQRIPLDILYPLLLPITRSLIPIEYNEKNGKTNNNNSPTSVTVPHEIHPCTATGSELVLQTRITQMLFDTKPLPRDVGMETLIHTVQTDPMCGQPVTIKERDVEYQVRRVCLFNRLLNALPATKVRLRLEVRTDIPPFLRARIWSALLGVDSDHTYRERYARALCSTTVHPANKTAKSEVKSSHESNNHSSSQNSDTIYGLLDEKAANQISVDLPRCHAYDALLASPMGQASLRRVLVATLLMHPGTLEYTQGMDSVAAVFVRLCFPDEALAAACLNALLRTKLSTFFSSDGFTHGLKQFFDVLLRLFAFHNPSLAVSLTDLNVPLVGLTTGWIYTLFAHAMPLDRVELMWDTLIVGPPSLSIFFYLAIFLQLDQQVNFEALGLEQICTILSNFPEIDLDKCRADALRYALATPVSLTRSSSWSPAIGTNLTVTNYAGRDARISRLSTNDSSSGANRRSIELAESLQEHTKDFATSAFYARLCSPDAWPEHLECIQTHSESKSAGQPLTWMFDDPLVSLLDVTDALEHLIRPDCVVIDVRPKADYVNFNGPVSAPYIRFDTCAVYGLLGCWVCIVTFTNLTARTLVHTAICSDLLVLADFRAGD